MINGHGWSATFLSTGGLAGFGSSKARLKNYYEIVLKLSDLFLRFCFQVKIKVLYQFCFDGCSVVPDCFWRVMPASECRACREMA